MSLFSSIRINNGNAANLAGVSVQSQTPETNVVTAVKLQARSASANKPYVVPVHQAVLAQPVLHLSPNLVLRKPSTSLVELAKNIVAPKQEDVRVRLPLPHGTNTLVPSYHLDLNAGKQYDPRQNQGFVTTTTKFQPYEQLTGIAQERPEVIMVTGFEPLFVFDVTQTAPQGVSAMANASTVSSTTAAGEYIGVQADMRNMMSSNVLKLTKNLAITSNNINQLISDRQAEFSSALNKLDADASFLLNLVRIIEAQKAQLDLRHDIYTVDTAQSTNASENNYVHQQVNASPKVPAPATPSNSGGQTTVKLRLFNRLQPKYDFVDVLSGLGYDPTTVKNIYSSTKVYFQLLLELLYAFKFHTLQFLDIDPSYQRNDTNPTSVLNPKVTRFGLMTNLPRLPTLDELVVLQPRDVPQALNAIMPAFQSIYQNVSFKNEETRVAALAHLLSTEYRYSYGLTLSNVQRTLSDYYGYTVTAGQPNSTIIDVVVGRVGNNITDFSSQPNNSLVSLAQQTAGSTGVLTFETKYIEGDTGTLSPGGDFYFDQVLRTDGTEFDTTNIGSLITTTKNAQGAFNIIVDGLNLTSKSSTEVLAGNNNVVNVVGGILTSTSDLINAVKLAFVDASGNTTNLLQTDRLSAVFARARNDNKLKAVLFLYVLSKVSRTYNTTVPFFTSSVTADNTPLVDYLVEQALADLDASVPESRIAVQAALLRGLGSPNSPSALTPQGIAAAMKSGTELTSNVVQLMGQIISLFRVQTQAIVSNRTVYNGYLDTVVMMVAFDLIISMIALYGNLNIVGKSTGTATSTTGLVTYIVSQLSTNHRDSVNELTEKVQGETARVQQMVLAITNLLTVLGGSLTGISNYLHSDPAVQSLREIAGILGNDRSLISMLFSEQQIQLLAANVNNLMAAVGTGTSAQQASMTGDNTDEEIKILDESDVPLALRNALLGFFGTSDFASFKGLNRRIMTVGIPQGFAARIKQKVNIQQQNRASFQNKRNDVVQVCVYKIDMVNSDIVYRPRRYLFELSRFPSRVPAAWLPLASRPGVNDIVNSIPTLNFSQNADTSTSRSITNGLEYASSVIAGNAGIKNVNVAFADDAYTFLAPAQKAEILQNHVVSQLLEAYIKLMTGIIVSEHRFDMSEVPQPLEVSVVKTVTEQALQHVSDTIATRFISPTQNPAARDAITGGILFSATGPQSKPPVTTVVLHPVNNALAQPRLTNPSGVSGVTTVKLRSSAAAPATVPVKLLEQTQPVRTVQLHLASLAPTHVPLATETLRTIVNFSNTLSTISDPASLNQRVVVPKLFDRVFNIVIDPTEFEVDVEKTTASPYGREALALMVANGEIVPATENDVAVAGSNPTSSQVVVAGSRTAAQPTLPPNVNNYSYRPRDIRQGDLMADKYFVTVETFDEGG